MRLTIVTRRNDCVHNVLILDLLLLGTFITKLCIVNQALKDFFQSFIRRLLADNAASNASTLLSIALSESLY